MGESVGTTDPQHQKHSIQKALAAVEEEGGKELVLEAIAICSMFHGVTRLLHATGQQDKPHYMYTAMTWFFRVKGWLFGY